MSVRSNPNPNNIEGAVMVGLLAEFLKVPLKEIVRVRTNDIIEENKSIILHEERGYKKQYELNGLWKRFYDYLEFHCEALPGEYIFSPCTIMNERILIKWIRKKWVRNGLSFRVAKQAPSHRREGPGRP